jgi:chromosome segregation ATPase
MNFKEKTKAFRDIKNPDAASDDLRLLRDSGFDKKKCDRFARDPKRYADDILFALLDAASSADIIRHRRSAAKERELTKSPEGLAKDLEEKARRLEAEKENLEAEKENLEEEKKALEAEKENLEAKKEDLEEQVYDLEAEKEDLEARLDDAKKKPP